MAAWGFGSVTVPVVIAVTDVSGALYFAGLIVPALILLRLPRLLAVDEASTVPAVAIALLRSLGIFRALPVPALEGVAQKAADVAVPAGG